MKFAIVVSLKQDYLAINFTLINVSRGFLNVLNGDGQAKAA